jgi:ketosteroid isomerase-like protein
MKNKLSLLLIFIISTFETNTSFAQEVEHTVKKEHSLFIGIKSPAGKVVSQFHHALKVGDKVVARRLLADDVLIFEGGGVERSADEYAHHHMLSDMKYLAAIKSKLIEHNVKTIGNSAISMSRSKSTGTYKGKTINYIGMETMVLEKQQGEWKIIRIHWSN